MEKAKVLLVDDDDIHIYLTRKMLLGISDKIDIEFFTNGKEALEYLKFCITKNIPLPGVILLDINMPNINGWKFLEEFKQIKLGLKNKVRIYLVTISQLERDKKRAEEFAELADYVVKPVAEDKLIEILNEAYESWW